MQHRIEIILGDITVLAVDAVVNAANNSLLGGGGVDGAIHQAAGPELLAACRLLDGCPTGDVRVTPAFRLPARYVFHTVGPVWRGGSAGEPELLRSCYHQSLLQAEQRRLSSVSFPAISCGVYGYPHVDAATIAIEETCRWLDEHAWPERVLFVLYDQSMASIYQQLLG